MKIVLSSMLILLISSQIFAQAGLHKVSLGDFKTTSGGIIKNCQIGYYTLGKLNAGKSNTILWATWFTGTSEYIAKNVVPTLVDTTEFYVIVADALGNGVSSSPSNTKNFPVITIHDMVNTQYELLSKHLNINHIYAVGGISMGGMQTLEWLVAYPDFMDKAICIVGTPKQSFYDLLLWNTDLEMIVQAEKKRNKTDMEFARKRFLDIDFAHLYTPAYFVRTKREDSLSRVLGKMYEDDKNNISNIRSQLQAMIQQDIYKSAGKNIADIKYAIKAKVLIIVALQDHMVNPQSSIELAKQISCQLEAFDNDCGHNLFDCGTERAKEVIATFLHK